MFTNKWYAKDGHVLVADGSVKQFEFSKKTVRCDSSVAFNVGDAVAKHIVALHNDSIKMTHNESMSILKEYYLS